MVSNFEFLKKDNKLFDTISNAEKLYRDGYFEQTIIQTRKFAEIVSRNVLGVRKTTEETFDDILSTLKDILTDEGADKEFMDDLYFLKTKGNLAAHTTSPDINGQTALECLQRAFEVSINYAVKNKFSDEKKLLNSHFSIDILMSGKEYKFSEKYQEIREKENEDLKNKVKELSEFAKTGESETQEKDTAKKEKKQKTKKEKNVSYVDFKKKKIKKTQKTKDTPKEEKQTKEKGEKPPISVILCFSMLFIFLISIIIFVLPV